MAYLTSDMSELLTSEHLDSLNKAKIWTVNDLCSANLMELRRTTSIKFHILKDLADSVRHRYTLPCIELDVLLDKCIREWKMCPTGLPELTSALDGGFQTQEIVEIYGDSGSGKTEMCYLLCGEILSHYEDWRILYIASNHDINHEKIARHTRSKAGNRDLSEDDIFNCLKRVEVARPMKLSDFVHLLNTVVHGNKHKGIRCIIIDSLSFIIQEEILEIDTSNLNDGDELEKFSALKGNALLRQDAGATVDKIRRDFKDIYLHEVMRLLINISISKNVIIVITNSDQKLTFSKSWTNAIDHRIVLTKMSEHSRYYLNNPQSTVCKATILKTIHNISKIGYAIPFAINDEGLFAIRLASQAPTDGSHQTGEDDSKAGEDKQTLQEAH